MRAPSVGDDGRPRRVQQLRDQNLAPAPLAAHRDDQPAIGGQLHPGDVMRQLRKISGCPQPTLPPQRLPRGFRQPLECNPLAVRMQRQLRHPTHMPQREVQVGSLDPGPLLPLGALSIGRRDQAHPERRRRCQSCLQHRPPAQRRLPQLRQERLPLVVKLALLVAHRSSPRRWNPMHRSTEPPPPSVIRAASQADTTTPEPPADRPQARRAEQCPTRG